ncbi:cation:proton antiporter [Streptomyces sp. NRRL B-1347]|uniref:cation:proton antiporter n=1 Tax=Streptomyces sp. NRRL B-1347 TaxID=1476877 RepID=UPI00068A6C36|nr:cation:proton antiporter [Streptomyces sp. NRRL B-1347]
MSTTELGPTFFLAVVVILVTCRVTALALRALGQPPVVGEMVAGVLLGPSLLGLVAPGVEEELFPDALRPVLFVAGQIGLVIFMFQAGYELRTDRLKPLAKAAGAVSAAGVLVPLALGTGLAWAAHGWVDILPAAEPLPVTCLFVGVALAVTAFPMMARIISERGLTGSRFGSLSLAAGALDDVVAWVLLAGVLSLSRDSAGPFAKAVAGAAGLVLVLALLLRAREPLARRLERLAPEQVLLFVVITLFLAAWYTDTIGLYAVFGAFSLGVVFPRSAAVDRAVGAVTPAGQIVFLPLFFTYSGLNTDFGLLTGPALLLLTAACVAAAVVGKFVACWLAARAVGEEQGVALRVGTLMNARGLMQLIAINVGLAAGIVSQRMFSMLVVVALVTTLMATPVLSLWDRRDRRARPPAGEDREPLQEPAPKAAGTGP